MSGPAGPSRRAFCAHCLLFCAGAAAAQAPVPAPPSPGAGKDAAPVPVRTRETRAGLNPGDVRDYRKEGRFFLVADATGIFAVTAVCTHMGCTVLPPDEDYDGFECPCHGSRYDRQGRVVRGPAQASLRHLPVREAFPGGPLEVDAAAPADPDARL